MYRACSSAGERAGGPAQAFPRACHLYRKTCVCLCVRVCMCVCVCVFACVSKSRISHREEGATAEIARHHALRVEGVIGGLVELIHVGLLFEM